MIEVERWVRLNYKPYIGSLCYRCARSNKLFMYYVPNKTHPLGGSRQIYCQYCVSFFVRAFNRPHTGLKIEIVSEKEGGLLTAMLKNALDI